jgi:hypothetical protein
MLVLSPTITSGHARAGTSVATTGNVYVETGVEVGGAIGVESPAFSTVRGVSEIGYLWERRRSRDDRGWGYGATLYAGLGAEDMRLGFKPRVRYRFRPNWSLDVSAGVIFATLENEPSVSNTGFVGGLHLNYARWLTLRVDVNVKEVADRTHYRENQPVLVEGGYETAVYGGVAFRNRAGWVATVVGTATVLAVLLVVVSSGGAS